MSEVVVRKVWKGRMTCGGIASSKLFERVRYIFFDSVWSSILQLGHSPATLHMMPSIADLEPQPQEAPLNPKALQALKGLQSKYNTNRELLERLEAARNALSGVTDQLNQRALEERTKHARRIERLQNDGEEEEEEDKEKFEQFQNKVEELTKRMDTTFRQSVDTRVWFEELSDSLRHVNNKAGPQSQATQQSTQLPTQDRSQRRIVEDDEEEEGDVIPRAPAYEQTPTALLRAALSTQATRWNAKTLTEKYARDNDYRGFYTTKWQAQHPPDNAPPVPAPAVWFALEEGNQNALSQQDSLDDTDVQVASESVSIRCPITLQPLKDPVTSSKCKHSFSRHAIEEMFKTTEDHIPFSPEVQSQINRLRGGPRATFIASLPKTPRIRCPECSTHLVRSDLLNNPALEKRVKRVLDTQRQMEEEQEDEEEEEEGLVRGTQRRPMGLGSSPMTSGRVKAEKLKKERTSGVGSAGGTQGTSGEESMVVDLEDDEDELMNDA